jgi:predicted Rossmann-fold nucleotide-binding protein
MAAVSKSFYETPDRRGLVIGILPCDESLEQSNDGGPNPSDGGPKPKDGYPNQWVEIPVLTHLPLSGERGTEPMSRNHINVLSSDVIVALSGDAGTLSEVRLAVRYGRPVIAFVESDDESGVESDQGIPGLPKGVPISSSLEEVQTFVLAQLGLSAPRG